MRPSSMSMRQELLDEERVPLALPRRPACAPRRRAPLARGGACDLARVIVRERLELDPSCGRRRRPVGLAFDELRRVGQTSRRRASAFATTCSTSSRKVVSAQWMSSNRTTSGRDAASFSSELASPPEELLHGERLLREPDRRRDAGASRRSRRRARSSFACASSGVSRSAIPATWRTASASGQKRDAVAVGEAAAAQNERVCVDGADELVQEP